MPRTRFEATAGLPLALPPSHTRATAFAVVGSLLLAGTLATAQTAQTSDRQRVLYVTVTDRAGTPVSGVTPEDLVVREDGAQREVLRVEPATGPIEITLVVDTSEAASSQIADIRRALTEFIDSMAKGNDIAITTTGGRPQVVQNYTSSRELLDRAVGHLFAEQGNGAYLLQALSSVAAGIAKRQPERAAIVAITAESGPEFSDLPYESVVKALADSGATFSAIAVAQAPGAATTGEVTSATPPTERRADRERAASVRDRDTVLDQGTRLTGGINIQALSGMALGPELKSLAAQLRSQYRVVYARPESLIPPEKIEVSAKKPGLTARGTPVKVRR